MSNTARCIYAPGPLSAARPPRAAFDSFDAARQFAAAHLKGRYAGWRVEQDQSRIEDFLVRTSPAGAEYLSYDEYCAIKQAEFEAQEEHYGRMEIRYNVQ
jgi:hypothetical protein